MGGPNEHHHQNVYRISLTCHDTKKRGKKKRRRVPNKIRGRSRILGCERERLCNREVVNGRVGNLLSVVTDDRDLGMDQIQSMHPMNIVILEV